MVEPEDVRSRLQLIAQGDEDAAQSFDDFFRQKLIRFLWARNISPQDCDDLVQEILAAAFWQIKQGRFRGESAVGTWLIGILKHKVADYWEQRHRDAHLVPLEQPGSPSEAARGVIIGEPIAMEDLITVRQLLEEMPTNLRVILRLHETMGWKIDEIATMLRMPSGTVGRKLAAAKEWLRQRVRTLGPQPIYREIFVATRKMKTLPSTGDRRK